MVSVVDQIFLFANQIELYTSKAYSWFTSSKVTIIDR